MNKTSKIF